MAKRRITKASKRRLSFFGTISVFAIIYFLINLIYSVYSISNLSLEKKRLDDLYIELQEKSEEFQLDIEKYKDPDYLADYARENYLYSKDGEYIIQIEEIVETTDKIDTITNNINKTYILTGLGFLIFLIFFYIALKSKNKNVKPAKK